MVGRPEGKRPRVRPRLRWKIILKWIFKMWNEELYTELLRLRIGTGCGLL